MDVVAMPQLGETVTEGTITAWSVAVGDRVEVDEGLFEVSTEKVDTEVPSAVAGHVRVLLVAAGETVPVGTPVAVITAGPDDPFDLDDLATAATGLATHRARGAGADDSRAEAHPGADAVGQTGGGRGHGRALGMDADPIGPSPEGVAPGASGDGSLTPVVRRLLAEHDLDASSVRGSGRNGRITRSDVLAAAAQRSAAPPEPGAVSPAPASVGPAVVIGVDDEVVEFSRAREVTAEHMSRSLAVAAHALVVVEVDYQNVEPVRRAEGLSYLPFVARAVVESLREFPHLNASVDGHRLVVRRHVNLGVAVDVDRAALVVPVLHHADELRLPALASAITDLADRARRRRLGGSELEGGTFTVTNVGSYGTVITAPIINQPQVGILSTDGVRMKPVAVRTDVGTGPPEWGVAVHPVGNLSLSFDHRAIDGAYAAAFLAMVRDTLQTRHWAGES